MGMIADWPKEDLVAELLHYQQLAALTLPSKEKLPHLPNIDYFAAVEPYKGCVGGDYLAVINFSEYNLAERIKDAEAAGDPELGRRLSKSLDTFCIVVADVSGHMLTDGMMAFYLDSGLRTGIGYEFLMHGEITEGLMERLNTRHYNLVDRSFLDRKPYITLLIGEVHNDGRFRFQLAGHPAPKVLSNEFDRLVVLGDERTRVSAPLGMFPSVHRSDLESFEPTIATTHGYPVNEVHLLGTGDVLVLHTDGLSELKDGELDFCDRELERVLRRVKGESARNIYEAIREEVYRFSPPQDDMTIAVIKKLS